MSQHIDPEVKQSFIVDNLTTNDAGKALSAAQGKALDDKITTINSKLSANCNIYNWGTVASTIASKIASESASHKGKGNWGARFYFSASSPPSDLPANELKWRYATGEFYARNTDNSGNTDGYLILRAFGTSETIECNVTANALGTWTSLNSNLTNNTFNTHIDIDINRVSYQDGGYVKVGNMVFMSICVKGLMNLSNEPGIFVIDSGYWPKKTCALSVIETSNTNIASALGESVTCGITNTGHVYIKRTVADKYYFITGAFIV